MNLLCLRDFNQGDISAKAGDVITVAPIVANRLLDSWPECWAVAPDVEPIVESDVETEAIDAPPKDKMIRKPAHAKAGKRKG